MIQGSARFDWHGEQLVLLPDRAVFLPEHATVLLADVHLGKPAAFRAQGLPVPEGVTTRDLERMSALVRTTAAQRLIILGDLIHDQTALLDQTCHAVRAWRESLSSVQIDLIPGNHDRRARSCEPLGVRVLEERVGLGKLDLTHEPPARGDPAADRPTLCGHIHPMVLVGGARSVSRVRTPCFWFDGPLGILPAFGSFTGGYAMGLGPSHGVFAAGDRTVIPVTGPARAWVGEQGVGPEVQTGPGTGGQTDAFAYDRP
jgi:DNA ligase-associated metallophosphoesterase